MEWIETESQEQAKAEDKTARRAFRNCWFGSYRGR